jgi:Tol biopolymer transport system component
VFTGDVDTSLSAPFACAGGRQLVFLWLFRASGSTQQLWRVNADGTNATALVDSNRVFGPTCSPDAQWVAFTHTATIDRVSLGGGTPEQLGQYIVQSGTDYSPDGRTIAAIALVRSAQPSVAARRMLVLLTPGSAPRLMDTDQNFAGGNVRFTRDGAAVAYAVRQKAADQIVIQPLDGSPHRTVTAFTSGRILSFAWSLDAQSLALTRGYTDSDVVLLTDTARHP